jgi:tetratricopeptide (TPR) repeat protein
MKDIETTDSDEHLAMAQSLFALGRYEDAALHYRQLIEAEEATAATYNDLANCYFKTEQFDQAELFYREALRLESRDVSATRNLGLTLARLDRAAEAIELLEHALAVSPDQSEIVHIIGDLHRQGGRFEQALAYYERYLVSHPADLLALFHLSECYLNMGHTDSAIMGYRRIIQLDPGFKPAQERLAALAQAGQTAPMRG